MLLWGSTASSPGRRSSSGLAQGGEGPAVLALDPVILAAGAFPAAEKGVCAEVEAVGRDGVLAAAAGLGVGGVVHVVHVVLLYCEKPAPES